jgi:hypothetical protein
MNGVTAMNRCTTIRCALAAIDFLAAASPAFAVTFEENDRGQIEFVMPSNNIGCIYTPEGGTDVYTPADGGPELSCDRVEPSYVRVELGRKGKARRLYDVGDPSCCGADNSFPYGATWKHDGFRCESSTSGLICERGAHGFSMSRKSIRTW